MATITEALALAVERHQAGDLRYAEAVYRRVLDADPGNADAWCYLATACLGTGRLREAAEHYRRSLELRPDHAPAYNDLGIALAQLGERDEAVSSFRHALRIHPKHADAYNNLGIVLAQLDRLDEAVASHQQALALRPDCASWHTNLGLAFLKQGKPNEARECYRRGLDLQPDYPEAQRCLQEATVEAWKLSIRFMPHFAQAHCDLGNELAGLGRFDEAVASYKRALQIDGNHAEAHKNLGIVWLLQGQFERAWPEYEWRHRHKDFVRRDFAQPRWDGSPLDGRTILLYAEQGFGDTLNFIRYVPAVRARGGRVVVECQPGLVPLLESNPGIDHLVAEKTVLPDFDVQAPLLSLPPLLGTGLAEVPYIHPDAGLVAQWRRELAPIRSFKIGIAWQGNPVHQRDRFRSVPLERFSTLARLAGVRLFSLQVAAGAEQLATASFAVTDLASRFETFADTAAALVNLDLVVSVDTAVVHCAGALGVPVWVALSYVPDWRWLLYREDSPWYPTLRMFRESRPGDWSGIFQRLTRELQKLLVERRP